jgi:hypothetical protein
MADILIEINECPNGHGYRCISIGNTRITPSKCCGSWKTVQKWTVDSDELIETIKNASFTSMRETAQQNRRKIYA